MSNIVKALRRYKEPVPHEAADRIEALEAALQEITFAFEATENAAEKMYFIASEALSNTPDKSPA